MCIQDGRVFLGNLNASDKAPATSTSVYPRLFQFPRSSLERAWTILGSFILILFILSANLPGTCEALKVSSKYKDIGSNDNILTDLNRTANKADDVANVHTGGPTSKPLVLNRKSRLETLDETITKDISIPRTGEDASRHWRNGPCTCWNSTDDGITREVECKCSGPNFTKLVTPLPSDVHRLTIEHAKNFITLSNEDIRPYANTLSELNLEELPQFTEIKSGTFTGMGKLNTVYIHGALSLTEIPDGVFEVFLPKLKLIRIIYTSLEVAPNLGQLHLTDALHMVELENSKISKLVPGGFHNLKTEHLALSYNDLREIGPNAFQGATIARLTLKGNRQLTTLHPDSFVGIESLRVLDLSETAITYLPTHGLKGLESLRLEKVLSLSVIPSIYHFQNLKEASLTWPYHCCAFEFPETHDPVAFLAYQEYVRSAVKELCDKAAENTTEPSSTSGDISESYDRSSTNNQIGWRRKRSEPVQHNNPAADRDYRGSIDRKRRSATDPSNRQDGNGYLDHLSDDYRLGQHSFEYNDDSGHNGGDNIANGTKKDPFDPFVFDPDRSFGSFNDETSNLDKLERESAITGEKPWGTFGHKSEVDFDEDIGLFHQSVTPSPTVITLCGNVAVRKPPKVYCRPIPDAFNPCEDIMGSIMLRGAVWIVVALALIGNTAVLVVLLLAPGRMSVQRFLMANLSWADLCMGIYLLMIATEDLVSLGSYFNYAIDWQLGWGCQIAGFITVFAAELSVFTLAVITGERWYALTRAIHLTKRLTIFGAAQLMAFGWIVSIILAGLPIVGVSSYSKTSICLPMDASTTGAVVYLSFLLLFNGLAFLLVATAYYQMYKAVAGHGGGAASAPGASAADTAIAKKMALLVFTDFACWAPVAFFGLTAVGGYPLIGVTDSKILLVFFYPLNSTLNPYLYAIMTKQYRRDLLLLLSRHGMCTRRAARYKTGAASTNNTLHTMQTVLRLGSVTETKVTQQPGSSPNGGTRFAGDNTRKELITVTEQLPNNNASLPEITKETESSSHIFDHPFLTPVSNSNRGQEGTNPRKSGPTFEEEDHMNGVDGRSIAETSFISVPSSMSSMGKGFSTGNSSSKHAKLVNQDSIQTNEDEHDLDHEISENTPFCTVFAK